jgi:hypothetical protein
MSEQQAVKPKFTDDDLYALLAAYPDLTKSAGIGAARGVIDTAGLPGDLSELGARGLDAAVSSIGNAFGQDWRRSTLRPDAPPLGGIGENPLTHKGITRGIEDYVTGPFYKPETPYGEGLERTARTVAGLATAAPALKVLKAGTAANIEKIERITRALMGK